ncbi:YmiA family putative membrane protein [Serratia grimesii]
MNNETDWNLRRKVWIAIVTFCSIFWLGVILLVLWLL